MALLFFHKPRTEAAKVNPKELYWSVISFGHAFTTNAYIANSNAVWYTNNELWRGRCLLCILDGFSCWKHSTEFQISEYVSIILSFLGMRSTPGVFIYTGVRENQQ